MLRLIHLTSQKDKRRAWISTITEQKNSVKPNETQYLFTSISKKRIDDLYLTFPFSIVWLYLRWRNTRIQAPWIENPGRLWSFTPPSRGRVLLRKHLKMGGSPPSWGWHVLRAKKHQLQIWTPLSKGTTIVVKSCWESCVHHFTSHLIHYSNYYLYYLGNAMLLCPPPPPIFNIGIVHGVFHAR